MAIVSWCAIGCCFYALFSGALDYKTYSYFILKLKCAYILGIRVPDLGRKLGQMWRLLSEEEKEVTASMNII